MKSKERIRNLIMAVLGCAISSTGFVLFLQPSGINAGGLTGVSMLVAYATDIPWLSVGTINILFNIPLFIISYRAIGKGFFFGSLLGMGLSSVLLDLLGGILPTPTVEPLVAVAFGATLLGVGVGLVFLAGASTGGVDILARMLKLKLRNFPLGKIILMFDMGTAVATGIVYKDFNNTLYSLLALFLVSTVLDKVLYSGDYAQLAIIATDKTEEVADGISKKLNRGVTFLMSQGYYLRKNKYMLLSVVKRQQVAQLKELVYEIDPGAFLVLQDAKQVLGDGFKRYDRLEL